MNRSPTCSGGVSYLLCAQEVGLLDDGSFFSMCWPDIIQFGRGTSDVIIWLSVTQSVRGWVLCGGHSIKLGT